MVVPRWGSAGDVVPAIAVGAELRRRGHDVTFVGNPHFAAMAAQAGLAFEAVGSRADHQRLMDDADIFGEPRKDPARLYADHYMDGVGAFYEAVAGRARHGAPVVVGGDLGSAFAAEKLGLPFFSIACSPASHPLTWSRFDPWHPERVLPRWAAWLARNGAGLAFLYALRDAVRGSPTTFPRRVAPARPVALPEPLARFRERVGLPRDMRLDPDLVLCMWPEWFAPPQRDWPAQALVAGFPLYPRPRGNGGECARGRGPVVVTTGSAAASQRAFYERAIDACEALGREAILVTPHREDVPRPLPAAISYMAHAPFEEIVPRASLVVHHGGIGTAAYALAAGVPQVVMPMRGDQFDNGNRLVRLGVAAMLCPGKTDARHLARTASRLLGSRRVRRRCEYWKSRIDPEEGRSRAADAVERLVARRGPRLENR
ncbi:MAG TPA: nucleotide disphospho-sugar-binding domain-containing protein [Usitatibacter sp.]|nr:nucleotide disphospho-sugar-binding domain-containing protein [Usitatibacter sp.]